MNEDKISLKPCPFCGSVDVHIKNDSKTRRAHYFVMCEFCGAKSAEMTTGWPPRVDIERRTVFYNQAAKEYVANAWNRRVK